MKKIFFILILLVLVISIFKINQEELLIPDNSIRLRIIPNSNNPGDIFIKEKVKKALEASLYLDLKEVSNIEDSRKIISDNIPSIEKDIEKIFQDNNYNQRYKINFGNNYFPDKQYKGKKYKEGFYESLVVTIGNGEGDNWWCVLFPNFCLMDLSNDEEYESYIYNLVKRLF